MKSEVVRLVGGPMNGWLVDPGAPALEVDWGLRSTGEHCAYFQSGTDEDGTQTAAWSRMVDGRTVEDPGPVWIAGERA